MNTVFLKTSFRRGFTLIELMVVISIIAILATIALFGFIKAQQSARDAARTQIMRGVLAAVETYYRDNQVYPNVFSGGVSYGWANMLWVICAHNYTRGTVCGPANGVTVPYLPKIPEDPTASCDNNSIPAGGPWYPCYNSPNPPAYYYEPSGTNHAGFANSPCSASVAFPQAYQLALVKEAGGIIYFCSPLVQ